MSSQPLPIHYWQTTGYKKHAKTTGILSVIVFSLVGLLQYFESIDRDRLPDISIPSVPAWGQAVLAMGALILLVTWAIHEIQIMGKRTSKEGDEGYVSFLPEGIQFDGRKSGTVFMPWNVLEDVCIDTYAYSYVRRIAFRGVIVVFYGNDGIEHVCKPTSSISKDAFLQAVRGSLMVHRPELLQTNSLFT